MAICLCGTGFQPVKTCVALATSKLAWPVAGDKTGYWPVPHFFNGLLSGSRPSSRRADSIGLPLEPSVPTLLKLRVQWEGEARYNRLAGAEPIRMGGHLRRPVLSFGSRKSQVQIRSLNPGSALV